MSRSKRRRSITRISRPRVLVCEIDGHVSERELTQEFGDFTSVFDIESVLVSTEPCE
jgi:hypothetical protein